MRRRLGYQLRHAQPPRGGGAVLGAVTNLNECKKGVTQKDLVDCATGDFYEALPTTPYPVGVSPWP